MTWRERLPAIARVLAQYELLRLIAPVKGSIMELGVGRGELFYNWLQLSRLLEFWNAGRRFIGFDTFTGIPHFTAEDGPNRDPQQHPLDLEDFTTACRDLASRMSWFKGLPSRVELIPGDITQTLPAYLAARPETLVALLYLDCDVYAPTKVALDLLLSRMPKGAVIVADELDSSLWPGETAAIMETIGLTREWRCFPWEGQIAYTVL